MIKKFRDKKISVLVATDVAARGIDVVGLTHVINFSVPHEYENYVHRIGRTGRAGKEGIAIIMVPPSEIYKIKRLQRVLKVNITEVPVPSTQAILEGKMKNVLTYINTIKAYRADKAVSVRQVLSAKYEQLECRQN